MKTTTLRTFTFVTLLLCLLPPHPVLSQNLLPNPSFENGVTNPAGWQTSGNGAWPTTPPPGRRILEIHGDGADSARWQSDPVPLRAGQTYALRFRGQRVTNSIGGTATTGTDRINRDFPLTTDWQDYSLCFRHVDDPANTLAQFGQWRVNGQLQFDDAMLLPAFPIHHRLTNGVELGEAESIRQGIYRFQPQFSWLGANAHRPLLQHHGQFNTDRFVFLEGSSVVYRFSIPGSTQTSANVSVNLNYHESGNLSIEASLDARQWQNIGLLNGARRSGTFAIPPTLLPAPEVFLRLVMHDNGVAQVNRCDYEATLSNPPPDAEGHTQFLEVLGLSDALDVTTRHVQLNPNNATWNVELTLSNRTSKPLSLASSLSTSHPSETRTNHLGLPAHSKHRLTLTAPANIPGPDRLTITLRDRNHRTLFSAATSVNLPLHLDSRGGYRLPCTAGFWLWWAEGAWKIGRQRRLPAPDPRDTHPALRVALARGEYEPLQLVLRPDSADTLESVTVQNLAQPDGSPSPVILRWDQVEYVHVTQPTDDSCTPGWYPDPLPPLKLPLRLEPGLNHPLWITVHAPPATKAGLHSGTIVLKSSRATHSVPIQVTVHDFDLPSETHLQTALGLGNQAINQHHHLKSREDQESVFNLYLQNFAEHRISPYSFYDYAPIDVRFPTTNGQPGAAIDFSRFDAAAMRWLDGARFNTFQLPLLGMGGGTFHSRHLGQLAGFKEGTPEHAQLFNDYLGLVQDHLRQRGWLPKAYTYWFDEPDPKDYSFVVDGMKRLKTAAPQIRRLLTEQPEPALFSHADIWCALTPEWTHSKVQERRKAGDEAWWYICTGPKAPYVTEFIDHPGTELRLWPWQSWQYDIQGLLIWATIYWHSPAAYPNSLQNPWVDPMSWVSGYDSQPGQRMPWGNGDGRFLYPPRPDPANPGAPLTHGPVNSIRWENLRDGLEDYEYLWLLRQRIEASEKAGKHTALIQQARQLLTVPEAISRDLTHFTTDPRLIFEHRDKVAQMIVQLAP